MSGKKISELNELTDINLIENNDKLLIEQSGVTKNINFGDIKTVYNGFYEAEVKKYFYSDDANIDVLGNVMVCNKLSDNITYTKINTFNLSNIYGKQINTGQLFPFLNHDNELNTRSEITVILKPTRNSSNVLIGTDPINDPTYVIFRFEVLSYNKVNDPDITDNTPKRNIIYNNPTLDTVDYEHDSKVYKANFSSGLYNIAPSSIILGPNFGPSHTFNTMSVTVNTSGYIIINPGDYNGYYFRTSIMIKNTYF